MIDQQPVIPVGGDHGATVYLEQGIVTWWEHRENLWFAGAGRMILQGWGIVDEAPPGCRRCPDCHGQEHHFLPIEEYGPDGDPLGYPCKHCDAIAPPCSECGEGFWPVLDDSGKCSECKFGEED